MLRFHYHNHFSSVPLCIAPNIPLPMHTQHSRAHQQGFLLLLLLVLLFKIPFTLRAGNRCCVPEFCTPRLIVTCRDLVTGPARVCFVYPLLDRDHFTRQLPSNHCFGVEGLSATVPHTHTLIKHQREREQTGSRTASDWCVLARPILRIGSSDCAAAAAGPSSDLFLSCAKYCVCACCFFYHRHHRSSH